MISKVITGRSFEGTCRYICMDENRAIVLETEGVRGHDYKFMAADFEDQHRLHPSLSKAVFHAILSFYPGEKVNDVKSVEIAKEYLDKMGITNTQYSITKHTDRNHPHLHVIANLVNNEGETIKDNWIGLKGKKVAQQLTLKYGLKQALGKNLELTHLERLNMKEANKYAIYTAILSKLPDCRSLHELKEKLQKENIETLYKYKSQTNELQGVSFRIGEYKYKGSEIDRQFSIKNLQKTMEQHQHLRDTYALRAPLYPAKKTNEINLAASQHLQGSNALNDWLQPEQRHEQMPYQWKIGKTRKKKKSKGLHL